MDKSQQQYPSETASPYNTPPPLCPHTGLSKHSDPVFPHFWVFLGTIVLRVPSQ